MKKVFLFSFLITGFSFLITSCHCKKKTSKSDSAVMVNTNTTTPTQEEIEKIQEQQFKYASEGYTKARVIYYELDGCNYILLLGDGTRLEPANLPQEYKKDKLDVWIQYSLKKGAVSVCMVGQIVELKDIQLRR